MNLFRINFLIIIILLFLSVIYLFGFENKSKNLESKNFLTNCLQDDGQLQNVQLIQRNPKIIPINAQIVLKEYMDVKN